MGTVPGELPPKGPFPEREIRNRDPCKFKYGTFFKGPSHEEGESAPCVFLMKRFNFMDSDFLYCLIYRPYEGSDKSNFMKFQELERNP